MVLHVLTISNILYRCSDDPYVEQVSEERLICVQLTILFHFNPLGPSIIYIFVLSQIFFQCSEGNFMFPTLSCGFKSPHINADLKNRWY